MRALRGVLISLIAMFPLVTLFHRNDLRQWDTQRSAMAGPDEFSYLLMAQHLLQGGWGGGLSLQADLGRDTFYPPGYPMLLAAWAKVFRGGLTAFSAHALNTALLSASSVVVYFLSRRLLLLLSHYGHRRFAYSPNSAATLALLISALFAANWHILETSLLIMSEPAFMLITFLWLLLALKWPAWHRSIPRSLPIILLAVAAWSIRGAGIVCVATTLLYPFLAWLHEARRGTPTPTSWLRRLTPILLALLLPLAYQIIITHASPEKSVTSGEESANSYPRQLLHGITNGNRLHLSAPADYPALAANLAKLILGHFNDYASSFVPWPRENPDFHFRDIVGKLFGFFALLGWLFHLTSRRDAPTGSRFLDLYLLLYISLYLVWPFNFARFWSPILPLMLVYAADAFIRLTQLPRHLPRPALAIILLSLLLFLSAEEAFVQLPNYARRLNYVSDSLAASVHTIISHSPDPQKTTVATMDGDQLFTLAWYFSQNPHGTGYRIHAPEPHLASKAGAGEHADEMLLRLLNSPTAPPTAQPRQLFLFSYFPSSSTDTADTLTSLRQKTNNTAQIQKIFQKEIIATVWQIHPPPPKNE